jgi:Fe-S cluster assembly protein SufB
VGAVVVAADGTELARGHSRLMSRGLSEEEAMAMVVNGFIEPIAKELPLEYAIELNRLIQLEMEGSVG